MNQKKGIFFTPLPPIWTNVSFSAIFFLEGIPYRIHWLPISATIFSLSTRYFKTSSCFLFPIFWPITLKVSVRKASFLYREARNDKTIYISTSVKLFLLKYGHTKHKHIFSLLGKGGKFWSHNFHWNLLYNLILFYCIFKWGTSAGVLELPRSVWSCRHFVL